jgi:hypothetical protein
MWLVATVTLEEARGLIDELLPIRISLDDTPGTERFVALESPDLVEMVEGRGLRVACTGRVEWSTRLGTLEMRIKSARALLVPSVVTEGTQSALRFHLEIEALDFEWVPGLVDAGIAEVIEKRLDKKPIAWRFSELFTRTLPMPASVTPPRAIDIKVREPSCAVSEIAMSFVLYVAVTAKSVDA